MLLAVTAQASSLSWNLDTVDTPTESLSMKLDSQGWPHIAYASSTDEYYQLKYAYFDGASWEIQTIEQVHRPNISANRIDNIALVMDTYDRPHIAYMLEKPRIAGEPVFYDVKYAQLGNDVWLINVAVSNIQRYVYGPFGLSIGAADLPRKDLSLALDAANRPHIAYVREGNSDSWEIHHSLFTGIWVDSEIDSTAILADYPIRNPSIVVDHEGRPHIAYVHWNEKAFGGDDFLKYARWNGSEWLIDIIDRTDERIDDFMGTTSLALDSNGHPHIAYQTVLFDDHYYSDYSPFGGLKYSFYNGYNWETTIVQRNEDDATYGNLQSLFLDSDGNAHISHMGQYSTWVLDSSDPLAGNRSYSLNNPLFYAHFDPDTGVWTRQEALQNTNVRTGSSIAVDPTGNVHMSYREYGSNDLIHAIGTLDITPPDISASISGPLGNNDWYTGDVAVTWIVTDDETEVTSTDGCDSSLIIANTKGEILTCHATSGGGTRSKSVTIKKDDVVPTINSSIAPEPNNNGWNNAPVAIGFFCTGGLSGVNSCGPDTIITSEGENQIVMGTVINGAGTQVSTTVNVSIDLTPPIITIDSPAEGTEYLLNQQVIVSWSVEDALSGVDTVDPTLPDGDLIDTTVTGGQRFVVNTVDIAGISNQTTVNYRVISAAEGTENLIDIVANLNLDAGIQTSLTQRLEMIIAAINSGDRSGSSMQLQGTTTSFINEVEALSGVKIDPADAVRLIEYAELILGAL